VRTNLGITLAVIFTGVVSFFVGALVARVYPDGHAKPLVDLMIASIGALAGTSAGAFVALSGARRRSEQDIEDRRVEAANVAIFNLNLIYDYLWHYNNLVIEPQKTNPIRWYQISRSILQPPLLEPFEVGRLAFLLEGENRELPHRLAAEFRRYHGFLNILARAREINDEIQLTARTTMNDAEIAAVGVAGRCNSAAKQTLIQHTDDIIAYGDRTRVTVPAAATALREAMLTMYPGRIIVPLVQPVVSQPL
jgi:hypothetical protein